MSPPTPNFKETQRESDLSSELGDKLENKKQQEVGNNLLEKSNDCWLYKKKLNWMFISCLSVSKYLAAASQIIDWRRCLI